MEYRIDRPLIPCARKTLRPTKRPFVVLLKNVSKKERNAHTPITIIEGSRIREQRGLVAGSNGRHPSSLLARKLWVSSYGIPGFKSVLSGDQESWTRGCEDQALSVAVESHEELILARDVQQMSQLYGVLIRRVFAMERNTTI